MGEFIIVKSPDLVQSSDEELLLRISEIIYPGFVVRERGENGLFLKEEGDYKDRSMLGVMNDRFQMLLGVLRAFLPAAGERKDELNFGFGQFYSKDEAGNQLGAINGVIEHYYDESLFQSYVSSARFCIKNSPMVANSFWLNGRRGRNAADYYMIFEYAKKRFNKQEKKMAEGLGVKREDLELLRKSANNLCPKLGGRHTEMKINAEWSLDEQSRFISVLLKQWCLFEVSES